jgi:hypothetical protein
VSTNGIVHAPPIVDLLLSVLDTFGRGRCVRIEARTTYFGGREEQHVQTPARYLPPRLCDLLAERAYAVFLDLRTARTIASPTSTHLSGVAAIWKPATQLSRDTGRHIVTAEAHAAIVAALERVPPPTFVVDAGPRVAAVWALAEPLRIPADVGRARALIAAIAARVGSDPTVDVDALVPLPGGVIRSWNTMPLETAQLVRFGGKHATYDVEQLEHTFTEELSKRSAKRGTTR